jgi:proteasome lid subunit RPN8/RPN11
MTTRLNSYILTDTVKEKMENTLRDTKEEEKGFTLCSESDNTIIPKGDYTGGSNKINIYPEICKDKKFVGGYHTHPRDDSSPSIADLSHCGVHKIVCIGGYKDNKIKCQIWKQNQVSKKDMIYTYEDIGRHKKLPTNPKLKISFDCANAMTILSIKEDYLNTFDDALNSIEKTLIMMKQEKAPRNIIRKLEKELEDNNNKRDNLVNQHIEQVTKGRKMYYNEVDLKLRDDQQYDRKIR